MKDRCQLLLLIVIPIYSLGQFANMADSEFSINNHDSNLNFNGIAGGNQNSIDTTSLSLSSSNSLQIDLPIEEGQITKVVLVKEESKSDYLKYLLPIMTLILGIVINKSLDRLSDLKKIKKTGRRWVAEIRSLEHPLNKQIESITAFLDEQKKEINSKISLVIYPVLSCEIFKTLDKGDFLKYINFKNRADYAEIVKISNKAHGYISILYYLHENLQDKYHDFIKGTSTHFDSLNRNLQSFAMAFADYGVALELELGGNPDDDARFNPILALVSDHIWPKMQKGDFNPFELRDKFFIPLMAVLSTMRLDDRTRAMSLHVFNCLNDIKGIDMERHYLFENMSNILDRYKTQLGDLEDVIKEIEGCNLKEKEIS